MAGPVLYHVQPRKAEPIVKFDLGVFDVAEVMLEAVDLEPGQESRTLSVIHEKCALGGAHRSLSADDHIRQRTLHAGVQTRVLSKNRRKERRARP